MKGLVVLLYGLLLSHLAAVSGLRCYRCDGIVHPRFCDHTEVCSNNEVCGITKVVNSFETTYDIGCVNNVSCSAKRSYSEIHACQICCQTDLCNLEGCGEHGYTSIHGPICFSCKGVIDMVECTHVNVCNENEICYIDKERIAAEMLYTAGCKTKHTCQLDSSVGSIFGKRESEHFVGVRSLQCRKCCDSNLCNSYCGNDTTEQARSTILPTPPSSETSTSTEAICVDHSSCNYLVTNLGICMDVHGSTICPLSCGKCQIPTRDTCIDTSTECKYLNTTYNICTDPDGVRTIGCRKTCQYCDIQVCDKINPCKNGGTCLRTQDWYKCHCDFGYGGKHCTEENIDTTGQEFYTAFLDNYGTEGYAYVYIVSKSIGSCTLYIPYITINENFIISNTSVYSYRINKSMFMNANGIQQKGIYIKCTVPVSLYGVNYGAVEEVDGYICIPASHLGSHYLVSSFTTPGSSAESNQYSNFGVVGTTENTELTIKFNSTVGTVNFNNQQYRTNEIVKLNISRLETFYISHKYDLSGTIITSSKPIVVLSGVRTGQLRNGYGNHMIEMMLPFEQLGQEFIIPTLYDSQCNFRIFATESTILQVNHQSVIRNIQIKAGENFEFDNYLISTVKASMPVTVQLYCNGLHSMYDAFMVTLPSLQHFKSHYQFPVVDDFYRAEKKYLYISVIIQADSIDSMRLNNLKISQYNLISNITMSDTMYSVLSYKIMKGLFEIKNVNGIPFGLIIFGRTSAAGYGYPGGFKLKSTLSL